MKNKSKPEIDLSITLLCHEKNLNRCNKLSEDSAFIYSLCKLAGFEEKPNTVKLKIGVVSDSNINDK